MFRGLCYCNRTRRKLKTSQKTSGFKEIDRLTKPIHVIGVTSMEHSDEFIDAFKKESKNNNALILSYLIVANDSYPSSKYTDKVKKIILNEYTKIEDSVIVAFKTRHDYFDHFKNSFEGLYDINDYESVHDFIDEMKHNHYAFRTLQ